MVTPDQAPARPTGRAGRPSPLPRHPPRVLMYHFFGDPPASGDPEKLFVTRQAFAAQLAYLRRRGWQALDLDGYLAALAGAPTPRRSFLLTIDDGHESVLDIAAPELAAAGVPSVLFVCPALLGERARWSRCYSAEPLASAARLRDLPGLGMELGLHGLDHTPMVALAADALPGHLARARTELEAATGVRARAFAYPFGKHDAPARRAVADAGFAVGFAVARETGRFAVDRVFVRAGDPLPLFRFKLTPAYRLLSRGAGRVPGLRRRVRSIVRLLTRTRETR